MKRLTMDQYMAVYDPIISIREFSDIREREFLYDDVGGVLRELLYLELSSVLRDQELNYNI